MEISLTHKRLSAVLATFIASLGCGTVYVYSAYSTQLADRLDLSATESSLIGMTGPVGVAMLGCVAGYLVDSYGMLMPSCVGTICLLLGYSTLYHCYVFQIRIVSLLCLSLGLAGFGSTMVYSACIKVAALNFPHHRGTAVSVPMSAFGLSAFLFSTVAGIMYPGDTAGFLKILSLLTTGLCFFNIPLIKVYAQPEQQPDSERQALLQASTSNSESSSMIAEYTNKLTASDSPTERLHRGEAETEVGGLALLCRLRYWQHFLMLGLVSGSGQMYIYCVGYVVRALMRNDGGSAGPSPSEIQQIQSLQVAIVSFTNFALRLAAGAFSDYLKRKFGLQRLWLVYLSLFLMMCGNCAAFMVKDESNLWIVSTLIGSAYGVTFGVYPTIVSESFGMKHFSQNWGMLAICQVTASYLYSYMFGRVFDSNSVPNEGGHGTVCLKKAGCYQTAFVVSLLLNGVACFHLLYIIYSNYLRNQRRSARAAAAAAVQQERLEHEQQQQ